MLGYWWVSVLRDGSLNGTTHRLCFNVRGELGTWVGMKESQRTSLISIMHHLCSPFFYMVVDEGHCLE